MGSGTGPSTGSGTDPSTGSGTDPSTGAGTGYRGVIAATRVAEEISRRVHDSR